MIFERKRLPQSATKCFTGPLSEDLREMTTHGRGLSDTRTDDVTVSQTNLLICWIIGFNIQIFSAKLILIRNVYYNLSLKTGRNFIII